MVGKLVSFFGRPIFWGYASFGGIYHFINLSTCETCKTSDEAPHALFQGVYCQLRALLKQMFLVRQPEELGQGRDAQKRLVQHPGVLAPIISPEPLSRILPPGWLLVLLGAAVVVLVVLVVLQGEIGKSDPAVDVGYWCKGLSHEAARMQRVIYFFYTGSQMCRDSKFTFTIPIMLFYSQRLRRINSKSLKVQRNIPKRGRILWGAFFSVDWRL